MAWSTPGAESARRAICSTTSPSRAGSVTVAKIWAPPTWRLSSRESPRAITRPWSITTMSSASRSASSRYWVVSRRVAPSSTSDSRTSQSSLRARGSRPVVGSSRNSTSGRATSVAARSRRRRMPPEYVLTRRPPASARANCSSSSSARARATARPRWWSWPIITRFSRPVSRASTVASWAARPSTWRAAWGSASTSMPETRAEPASGTLSVVSTRTAVVLPAPLGPSRPHTVPRGTSKLTPSRAVFSPNRLMRPSTSMAFSTDMSLPWARGRRAGPGRPGSVAPPAAIYNRGKYRIDVI